MKASDAKAIDLNDWELSGGGAQGESFTHKSDKFKILKLYPENADLGMIINEIELARGVQAAGVTCPAPGEFVHVGNRYGIIFEKIQNKKSFCRAIADDPSVSEDMARRFAIMGKDLHQRSSEGTIFISEVGYYQDLLDNCDYLDAQMRVRMQKALDIVKAEDTKTLLHGDYHFGNTITDGVKDYFIDLGSFAYGNAKFDNSLMYSTCNITPDEVINYYYHISHDQAAQFWQEYKKYYYGEPVPSDEQLYKDFLPYLLLRTLFFVSVVGQHPDVMKMMKDFSADFDLNY